MKRNVRKMLLCLTVFTLSLELVANIKISVGAGGFYTSQQFSIQELINNATSGDTIIVPEGIYQESIIINKTLTILGENESTTIIQANATDVVSITANNVNFSKFTIRNGRYGVNLSASNCTLTRNLLYNNSVGIAIFSASNNTISKNILVNNTRDAIGSGIWLEIRSNKNTLIDNTIIDNAEAIYLRYSSNNNTIARNLMINNSKTGTCLMYASNYNTIHDNVVLGGHYGVDLWTVNHNIIYNNTYKDNAEGFEVDTSDNNTFYQNNLVHNWKGIYIQQSINNTFYQNNLIGNTLQISVDRSESIWDNGFDKGNYWSDYVGSDLYYGHYQNETGSDGVGDTPYIIPKDDQDSYPLMKPYPWKPWTSHDIGIADFTISKSIIGQGFILSGRLTVFNYGSNTEVFSAIIHANATSVVFANIVLRSRNFTIITFDWSTTGWAMGKYGINAEVTPVLDETDLTDNTHSGSKVKITIPGDCDGDGRVNIKDATLVGIAWNKTKGASGYNPNADFNMDGLIDVADADVIRNNWQNHA